MNELNKKDKLIILDSLFQLKYNIYYFGFDPIQSKSLLQILNLYNVITDLNNFEILMNSDKLKNEKVRIIDQIINNINFI